jgi:hypothetical protein
MKRVMGKSALGPESVTTAAKEFGEELLFASASIGRSRTPSGDHQLLDDTRRVRRLLADRARDVESVVERSAVVDLLERESVADGIIGVDPARREE